MAAQPRDCCKPDNWCHDVPRPGVRLLIEDVGADALRESSAHLELTRDMLAVGRPREVIAFRVRRLDVTAIVRLFRTSARWGGVLLGDSGLNAKFRT